MDDFELAEVFKFLSARDLCRCAAVSRRWRRVSEGDWLWRAQLFAADRFVAAAHSKKSPTLWKSRYRVWHERNASFVDAKKPEGRRFSKQGPLPLLVSAVCVAAALAWVASPTVAVSCTLAVIPLAATAMLARRPLVTAWLSVFQCAFAVARVCSCTMLAVQCHPREVQAMLLASFLARSGFRLSVAKRALWRHVILCLMPYGASSLAVICGSSVLCSLVRGRVSNTAFYRLWFLAWIAPLFPALLWVFAGWRPEPFPPLFPSLLGPKLALQVAIADIVLSSREVYRLLFRSRVFLRILLGIQRF